MLMSGVTQGTVRLVLRLEGLCVLIAAASAYSRFGLGWGTFALYFLTPDISLFGYLWNAKVGAISYNLAHSYIGAIVCVAAGVFLPAPAVVAAGLIWCAHIGFDRALGFGLKYADGFRVTHLGLIGRLSHATPRGEAAPERL
jgi:hypothetical protein